MPATPSESATLSARRARILRRYWTQAVLFDLDDTLADRSAAVRRFASLFYESLHSGYVRDEVVESIVSGDRGGYGSRQEMFESFDRRWPESDLDFDQFVDMYETDILSAYSPDPRVTNLLDQIDQHGLPWGIVTNGTSFQHKKVRRMGLEGRTPCVVVSDEFGHSKPEPEIFLEALRLIGHPDRTHVIFVGDNPEADIMGAKSLGMRTAWVHRGRNWPSEMAPPNHVIGHVEELGPILFP